MAFAPWSWRPLAAVLVVFVAVTALGVSACDGGRHKKSSVAGSMAAPIVAATVNGKPIYIADVESEAVAKGIIREGEEFDSSSDTFYQVLEDLIESRLLAMEAEKRELDRNADVRHRLERARDLILSSALSEQIRETAIDEAAVEKMYREQIRLLKGKREVHIRHAVFPSKEAALAAKRRLDAGQSTFEEVAYDLSLDRRTGPEGGDLGFRKPEDLADSLRDAIANATPGQLGGPVQVGDKWELFRLEERREGQAPSIDTMRPQLEQWLMFEELRRVVDKLKSQARIERIIEEKRGASDGPDGPDGSRPALTPVRPPETNRLPLGPGAIAGATAGTPTPSTQSVLGGAAADPAAAKAATPQKPAAPVHPAAGVPKADQPPASEPAPRRRPSAPKAAPAPPPGDAPAQGPALKAGDGQ